MDSIINTNLNDIKFSCVVDEAPKFARQCFIFVNSLINNALVKPDNIVIHLIARNPELEEYLRNLGISIINASRWGDGKYCNKLCQFDTEILQNSNYVYLCDCDVAFSESPVQLSEFSDCVVGKTVDANNPSIDVLEKIFARYNCPATEVVKVIGGDTFKINCNGGVIGIPGNKFCDFGNAWRDFACQLLDDQYVGDLLQNKRIHIDQISFAMAVSNGQFSFRNLPTRFNTPIHNENFLAEVMRQLEGKKPVIIHYHSRFNHIGLINHVGERLIDDAVDSINENIQKNFNNRLFWDFRYAENPELGSGIGSRGDTKTAKQKMLKLLGIEKAESVLDIGCGDGEVLYPLRIKNYTGIDISHEALSLSRKQRPHDKFLIYNEKNNCDDAEFVICLDVLLHQDKAKDYNELIQFAAIKTKKRLIISGYGSYDDVDASCMCRFYEDIRTSLENIGCFKRIYKFFEYRGMTVLVADKTEDVLGTNCNNNDMDNIHIESVLQEHPQPDEFLNAVAASRTVFGWYTKHFPRVFEYPWILSELGYKIKNISIAEFGAGLSPLPLILSQRGASVTTIDFGPELFIDETRSRNEWGYFNYASFDSDIKSINGNLDKNTLSKESIDVWYSVSVVEHMPAEDRRKVFRNMSYSLKTGGKILLTVDVCKNSDFLWNVNQGKEVENKLIHGTVSTIPEELQELGFCEINTFLRKLPDSQRVDTLYVSAVKTKNPVERNNDDKNTYFQNKIKRMFSKITHLARERHTCKDIEIIKESGLFDPVWYLRKYQDACNSNIKPVEHYVLYGWRKGYNPSTNFNTVNYLKVFPESSQYGHCPFTHYIKRISDEDIEAIVPEQVKKLLEPFNFESIYDLGNKKTKGLPYSLFFKMRNIRYISIDINGLDGALPYDLTAPLNNLEPFDIVANIGTTEHIEEQKQVFCNIHNISKKRMAHWLPLAGKHSSHGCWGYTLDFFRELAQLNDYKIEKLYIETSFKRWTLVCCSFHKKNISNPFVWSNELTKFQHYNPDGSRGASYR